MANIKHRGAMLSTLAPMQNLGILANGAVVLAALNWYKSSVFVHLDQVWHLSIWIGVMAGLLAFALRYNLPETPRFTIEIDNDDEMADRHVAIMFGHARSKNKLAVDLECIKRLGSNRPSGREFCSFFFTNTSQLRLIFLGICVPRFVIHTILYGLCLNPHLLFNMIDKDHANAGGGVYSSVSRHAVGQIIVNLISLPGYL